MGDRYDEMKGPELAAELASRELPMQGRVDELRDRLREDDAQPANDPSAEDAPEESETDDVEVPEPREPIRSEAMLVYLTEEQARALTSGEAALSRFMRHVMPIEAQKYCAGDQVMAVESDALRVLPFGIEIPKPEEG